MTPEQFDKHLARLNVYYEIAVNTASLQYKQGVWDYDQFQELRAEAWAEYVCDCLGLLYDFLLDI